MRVLFVTSQVITRHATMKRAAGLARPLLSSGCKVEVLAEDHPDNREYLGAVEGMTCSYFPAGVVWAERNVKNEFLREARWDLVHVCGLGWRNAIRRTRSVPLVVMEHAELESSLAGSPFLRRLAQWNLERWSRRYYHAAIGASRWLTDWLQTGGVRTVQYLQYGADEPPATIGTMVRDFKARKGLPRYALYCGGMFRNYGFWTMLEAFITLARGRPDFTAIMLGRGPEAEAGVARIRDAGLAGRIRFPGFVPEEDLQLYLHGAAVHLSPLNDTVTDRARCPSKIPLYMMTRRPIVTCRIGEAWEYLGEMGYYYAPGSVESLIPTLERAWLASDDDVRYKRDCVSWPSLASSYREFWSRQLGRESLER